MLLISDIQNAVRPLLDAYGFSGATLFGSYATGSATSDSDVDVFVQAPEGTKTKRVFAFAYDLGEALGVDVDAYGSHEVPKSSSLYHQIELTGVALFDDLPHLVDKCRQIVELSEAETPAADNGCDNI